MHPDVETVPAQEVGSSDLITLAVATNKAGESVYSRGEVIANRPSRRNGGIGYREIKTIAGTVLTVPNRFPVERVKLV